MKLLQAAALVCFTIVGANGFGQNTVQDEIRSTSGHLKETYGLVSQQLAMLNRTIGPDATKATPEQATKRDAMKASLTKLEGMLTTVNTANEADWAVIKAKADMVDQEARKFVPTKEEKK